jgi:hypothetical protein
MDNTDCCYDLIVINGPKTFDILLDITIFFGKSISFCRGKQIRSSGSES